MTEALTEIKMISDFMNYVFVEDLICYENLVSEFYVLKIEKLNF